MKADNLIRVSIIIPIYNVEEYLEECLQSVRKQTLREIEIICVDDGSTDSSGAIVEEHAKQDKRIVTIRKENGGYGSAVNSGIKKARGEYIGIVEPDDYVHSKMFQTLWKCAKKHDLDFVKGDFFYFKGSGKERVFQRMMISPKIHWYFRKFNPSIMPELLEIDLMNVTGIYRTDFLHKKNILLRETPGAAFQDTGLWIQIITQAESCMFLPMGVYYIRRDNVNSSVLNEKMMGRISEEYEYAECWLKRKKENMSYAPFLFKKRVTAFLFATKYSKAEDLPELYKSFARTVNEAKAIKIYDKTLFSESMNNFIEEVSLYQVGQNIPFYSKPVSVTMRIYTCIKEHGIVYTINRFLYKIKFKKNVY